MHELFPDPESYNIPQGDEKDKKKEKNVKKQSKNELEQEIWKFDYN